MALERKWDGVPARSFTADGSAFGHVTVEDTIGFYVKQSVALKSNTLPNPIAMQVKRVISPTQLIVGMIDNNIPSWRPVDISAYTLASGASISAEEQKKNEIPDKDHYAAIYEADPIVADRVIEVDPYGRKYTHDNPYPVIRGGRQIVPDMYDEVVIVRDCEDYPTQYQFYLNAVLVGTIDVSYNCDKSAVRYKGDNET